MSLPFWSYCSFPVSDNCGVTPLSMVPGTVPALSSTLYQHKLLPGHLVSTSSVLSFLHPFSCCLHLINPLSIQLKHLLLKCFCRWTSSDWSCLLPRGNAWSVPLMWHIPASPLLCSSLSVLYSYGIEAPGCGGSMLFSTVEAQWIFVGWTKLLD